MTRRTSRTLIGFLCVTSVFGLAIYGIAHRSGHKKTAATSQPSNTVEQAATLLIAAPPTTQPLAEVAQPTPQPIAVAAKPMPTPVEKTNPNVKPVAFVQSPASTVDKGAIADGKAKIAAGDLIAGRKILNDALMSGQLADADATAAKQAISDANKSIIFSTKRYPDDPFQESHTVAPGQMLAKIAFKYAVTPDLLLRINGISDARHLRAGANIKVIKGPFHVVVTKHLFTMDVYLGSPGEKDAQYVTSYAVGLGRADCTPTGNWMVEQRIPNPKYYSPRGEGTVEAGDPKNPLGKFWIALTGTDGDAVGKQSYGIHGTIDPTSIGKQSSMGCIRMHNEDVAIIYELVVSGQSIVIVKP
jgi:lipoprotein-anchoring transpeptidase ErfK/SrfK